MYHTPTFNLRPGLNVITFDSKEPATLVVGDPKCAGPARLMGSECNTHLTLERSLSILFQDISVVDEGITPVDVPLSDGVTLLGYQCSGEALPRQRIEVLLYWQTRAPLTVDYTTFIHLIDPTTGTLIAQFDNPPVDGLVPTSKWTVGDVMVTRMMLELPSEMPPGNYDLLAGMYTYPDLVRLPVWSERPFSEHGLVWLLSLDVALR